MRLVLLVLSCGVFLGCHGRTGTDAGTDAGLDGGTLAGAPPGAPRILYSDLESGPATGGENGQGALVTLWGHDFGATRGSATVSVNGTPAAAYPLWSDDRVAFQVASGTTSGAISLTTSLGAAAGPVFTVRSGRLYFVATSGNDSADGSAAHPWKTVIQARTSLAPGDTVYLRDGLSQTGVDDYDAALWLGDTGNGTAATPIAFVAYPGATVTIGDAASSQYGIRGSDLHGANNYYVLSGLTVRASNSALDTVDTVGWKVVGNDFSCPGGSGESACVHTDTTTQLRFWGNSVHDVGTTAGAIDKYYHAVYFTTNSNHIDVGWNTIVPNPSGLTTSGGCRAMQFYSTGGADQFDLHVHDNLIHDAICDGINFATVNPDHGTVEAYNNIVYHVGTGPDPDDGAANYACVNDGSSGTPSATVEIYNNTFVDCGGRGAADSGGLTLYTGTRLRDNVLVQKGSEPHLGSHTDCSLVTGSNNLFSGGGAAPSCTGLTNSLASDPLFSNAADDDFHLQPTSPARDTGVDTGLTYDFDGTSRPQGAAYDRGAYER